MLIYRVHNQWENDEQFDREKKGPGPKQKGKRKEIQMNNKCIKICSKKKICSDSSTIKKTKIKMKCFFLFIGLARILKYDPIQQ